GGGTPVAGRGVRSARRELLRLATQREQGRVQARAHQPERVRGMDRLSTVRIVKRAGFALALVGPALGAGGGCDGDAKGGPPASRSRVEAVQADAPAKVDPKAFCETWHEPDSAPVLTLPPLREPAPAKTAAGHSRWINVWATWCKPCIEELPRLARWREALAGKGDFELWFLSADGDPEAVRAFAQDHPE